MEGLVFYKLQSLKTLIKENSILYGNLEREYNDLFFSSNERVLYDCFSKSRLKTNNFTIGDFKDEFLNTKGENVYKQYPFLKKLHSAQESKVERFVSKLFMDFFSDIREIHNCQIVPNTERELLDVKIGAGDFHNGKSTVILKTKNKNKIVYKPNNGGITHAYHSLLDWTNNYFPLGKYKYNVLNRKKYHWMEFVEHKGCQTCVELEDYYKRAGFMLAIIYLLNGSDFHYENLIANGSSPVLIDHETIIQPKICEKRYSFFKSFNVGITDSIFNSLLLPQKDIAGMLPMGVCGFGWQKQTQSQGFQKVGINRFTDDWKVVTKSVTQKLFKNNIPTFMKERIYPNEYINELVFGFESCYNLLLDEKDFLLSKASPLQAFSDKQARFIWRPTNAYVRIQNQMRLPKNVKDDDFREQRIKDYLAVAFKDVPLNSDMNLILKSEVSQMLRGDIPYFEINTSSRDLSTEFGNIKGFFELSCMENLERKIKKLSKEDLKFQKSLIFGSYNA